MHCFVDTIKSLGLGQCVMDTVKSLGIVGLAAPTRQKLALAVTGAEICRTTLDGTGTDGTSICEARWPRGEPLVNSPGPRADNAGNSKPLPKPWEGFSGAGGGLQ